LWEFLFLPIVPPGEWGELVSAGLGTKVSVGRKRVLLQGGHTKTKHHGQKKQEHGPAGIQPVPRMTVTVTGDLSRMERLHSAFLA
jgi:hypothetical protein